MYHLALPGKSDLIPHRVAFRAVLEVEVSVWDWEAMKAQSFNLDSSQLSWAPWERRKLQESTKVESFVCNTVFLLKEARKGLKPKAATIG